MICPNIRKNPHYSAVEERAIVAHLGYNKLTTIQFIHLVRNATDYCSHCNHCRSDDTSAACLSINRQKCWCPSPAGISSVQLLIMESQKKDASSACNTSSTLNVLNMNRNRSWKDCWSPVSRFPKTMNYYQGKMKGLWSSKDSMKL